MSRGLEVSTARELFELHPGVSVSRDRIGMLDAAAEPGTVCGEMQLTMHPTEFSVDEIGVKGLAVVATRPNGASARLKMPNEPLTHEVTTLHNHGIADEDILGLAGAAVELFDGYLRLSREERYEMSIIPGGNAKIYDWMESPEANRQAMRESSVDPSIINAEMPGEYTLAIARTVFLGNSDSAQ